MFEITMLPGLKGDCLWIEYGDSDQPHIILIDGGMPETAAAIRNKIEGRTPEEGLLHIELIVVTHIDVDHIGGIVELIDDPERGFTFGDIWFNGYEALKEAFDAADSLGFKDGDKLSDVLKEARIVPNKIMDMKLLMVDDKIDYIPEIDINGGMKITVLGPPEKRLKRLFEEWDKWRDGKEKKRRVSDALGRKDTWPARWKSVGRPSTSTANKSSIALVMEFGDKRVYLSGDAHAPDMKKSVKSYFDQSEKSGFDAVKVSHHGSVYNIDEPLVKLLDTRRYLISTSGKSHSHPDYQALLRIIKWSPRKPTLYFNYKSKQTKPWANQNELNSEFQNYNVEFGNSGTLTIKL